MVDNKPNKNATTNCIHNNNNKKQNIKIKNVTRSGYIPRYKCEKILAKPQKKINSKPHRAREKRRDKDVHEHRGSWNSYRLDERYKVAIIQQNLKYQKTLVGVR